MKKLLFALLSCILFFASCSLPKSFFSNNKELRETETDQPGAMMQWEHNRVKDPMTGEIPKQNLVFVYNQYLDKQNSMAEAAVTGISWTERGPNNIGGRTRSIIFDKKDATNKTVWAASVGGGLFKCTDIDATTPSWSKVNDFFTNIAITTIAQNPSYPDTMYFGTGESFGNADGLSGAGIWRSIDNGLNWTQLSATASYYGVTRMVVASNGTVYAALSSHYLIGGTGGLYKSVNGGTSWTAVLTTSTTPAAGSNYGNDIKMAANGDLFYSCNGQVWKCTYSSGIWTNISPSGSYQRIEIACAPSNSSYIYLLCQGSSSALTKFYTSTNAGSSWTSNTLPLIYDQNTTNTTEFTRGQSWYDLSITVDPNTATTVYAGAIDYIKSTDAGASYKQISAWSLYNMPGAANLGSSQVMHSDHHQIVFKPGSSAFALFGCDGGIYKSTNMSNNWPSVPSYAAINTNYNVTQLYSCAMANVSGSNNFIGGAQDNGSLKFSSSGINSVTSVSGGDGCYAFIDQNNSNNQISSYVFNNYYVSTNASTFNTLSGSNGSGSFVNPADLDGVNDIFYSYSGSSTLARWTNVFGSVTRTNITITGVGIITHIKVSPNDPTTIYLGNSTGSVYRVTGANTGSTAKTPVLLNSSSFGGNISCIDVRKNAAAIDDTILVSLSNYNLGNSVQITKNATSGSPVWTDIDDNSTLPNIPVNWCLFIPTAMAKEVMLATEMGIYTCDDIYAAAPVWGQSNTGFANVRVDMLKIRSADSLIAAATHGRGLYTTDKYTAAIASFTVNKTVTYIGSSIQFTDASQRATSWAWDFDNNGSIDATTQNPSWAYGSSGYKTVSLTINGNINKTLSSYIQVMPNKGLPYTTTQGGDFESNTTDFGPELISGINWELGNSSVTGKSGVYSGSTGWVTGISASTYNSNNEAYLYTPEFNLFNAATDSIKFYLKNIFELSKDGLRVEYTIDGGSTWTPLGTSTATNWYDFANSSGGSAFTNNQAYFNSTNSTYTQKKFSLSFLTGNKHVGFRFAFKSDASTNAAGVSIDNFEITSGISTAPKYNVEMTAASKSEYFGPNATVDFYSSNGKILASLTNNSSHDYGLTAVTIDNTGTGAINYGSNTLTPNKILQKTLTIIPTTNNITGNYTIKLYYDASEISGWQTITSNSFSSANILKCPISISNGTIANGVYGSSRSISAYGAFDSSITATFATGFSGFSAGLNSVILPVSLVSFDAVKQESNVTLHWTTSTEKNNYGFELERGTDGRNWDKIAFINGKGNSYHLVNYSYLDKDAFENGNQLYYRLKQIDFNGDHKYSEIRAVESKNDNSIIKIFPQPARESIQIITSEKNGFSYSIISYTGQEIIQGNSKTNSGMIDISLLAPGVYYIRLISGTSILNTKKFIKIE